MKLIGTAALLCVALTLRSQPGEQAVLVKKGDVAFNMLLLSASRLSPRDTLKIRFTIVNNSNRPIFTHDCDIAGKQPYRHIFFARDEELSLDLGCEPVLDLGGIRKFRQLNAGEEYPMEFALPMSKWWANKRSRSSEKDIKRTEEYVDISVVAYVSFSDSDEFSDGSLASVSGFDDYVGPDHGQEGVLLDRLLQRFAVSGITITASK
jgi:hypothetical protein